MSPAFPIAEEQAHVSVIEGCLTWSLRQAEAAQAPVGAGGPPEVLAHNSAESRQSDGVACGDAEKIEAGGKQRSILSQVTTVPCKFVAPLPLCASGSRAWFLFAPSG